MSTNGDNGEETEMMECEGEKVVTMMDVLKEQQEFEEDANAVLGASDDKNCTYNKGYVKRQAVYACLTCCIDAKQDPDKRAGVCLACSLTCHENHDLVELYTKRNFRCDCGNPKFNHPCQYTENKTSLNDENTYNQNFSGLYCTCHRPYPDPDGVEEEMIQCIVCEDWLHSSHLDATVPSPELYAEMICKSCMDKNEFLHDYSKYAVNGDIDVVGISDSDDSTLCNGNTNNTNGVDTELNQVESEEVIEDKLTKVDDPIEAMDTSHRKDENNIQEQMQPDSSVTNKPEDDILVTEKTDDENLAAPDVNSSQNLTKDSVTGNTEDANPTEVHLPKDNTEDNSFSNVIIDSKFGDNVNSVASSDDQESFKAADKKNDVSSDLHDPEERQLENLIDTLQETNGTGVNEDLQAESKTNKNFDNTSQEKQDPTVSNDTSGDNKNIETLQNTDIHSADGEKKENKRKLSTEESTLDVSVKKPKLSKSDCLRPQGERKRFKGATFWAAHFRQKLCTCNECIAMYKDLSVLFLIDLDDTVTAYETLGKEKTDGTASTQYEKGLEALSSLGRIQQINALTEYNKMRDKLLDFLKSFKDRKEVVKEEDIKAFFAGMKPKREPDGVYFCR